MAPKAKPSPYTKSWWTRDLTEPCRIYTHCRNRARTCRWAGWERLELQLQTKEASKEYHDAIRKQKKTHWDEFFADDINICQAAWYKKPAFDEIPPLTKADDSATMGKTEQATELLKTVFLPLQPEIEDKGSHRDQDASEMLRLAMEEVERLAFEAES